MLTNNPRSGKLPHRLSMQHFELIGSEWNDRIGITYIKPLFVRIVYWCVIICSNKSIRISSSYRVTNLIQVVSKMRNILNESEGAPIYTTSTSDIDQDKSPDYALAHHRSVASQRSPAFRHNVVAIDYN